MTGATSHIPFAIIGGGIAGLSAAIALARKGHAVTVFERRHLSEEAGAGIQLSPNASHILLRWGLGGILGQTAVAPTNLAIRRWGEPRAYAQMLFKTQADGAPFWVILRQDLHRALSDAASRNPLITIHQGWELQGVQSINGMQRLVFDVSGAQQIVHAQCLLGADGQYSTTRRLLGDARSLDSPGWEAWRSLIPAEKTLDFIKAAQTNLWLGRDAHAVHYPVAGGKLINLVVIQRLRNSTAATAENWGQAAPASGLNDVRSQAAPTLRDLIDLAPQWNVWTLYDRQPSPFMAKETTALIGDAAHPILPFMAQGAAMAIEDAETLAHVLPRPDALTEATLAQGLKEYAAMRAPRVQKVYKAARDNAFAYHLSPLMAWFRDRRMASLGSDGLQQRYEWLYNWRSPE